MQQSLVDPMKGRPPPATETLSDVDGCRRRQLAVQVWMISARWVRSVLPALAKRRDARNRPGTGMTAHLLGTNIRASAVTPKLAGESAAPRDPRWTQPDADVDRIPEEPSQASPNAMRL